GMEWVMADKAADRRLRTLLTDAERDAYLSLSAADRKRVNEGERIECAEAGLAFHFHSQEAQVSGRELRVIVATPLPTPADSKAAYVSLQDIHQRIYAEVPREHWTILNSYTEAWGQYAKALQTEYRNKSRERAKRLAESEELPALLASELARMKGHKAHEN